MKLNVTSLIEHPSIRYKTPLNTRSHASEDHSYIHALSQRSAELNACRAVLTNEFTAQPSDMLGLRYASVQ